MTGPSATHTRRRRWSVALQIAKPIVGIAILIALVRMYDVREVAGTIMAASPFLVALAILSGTAAMVFLAHTHHLALKPFDIQLSTWRILRFLYEVRFYALFLPGGTGALVKFYKFTRASGRGGRIVAMMAVVRTLNLIALFYLVAFAAMGDPKFPWPDLRWWLVSIPVLLTVIVVPLFSRKIRPVAVRILTAALDRIPLPEPVRVRAERIVTFFATSGQYRPRALAWILILSGLVVIAEVVQDYCLTNAIDLDVSLVTLFWLRGIIAASLFVPFTVAGLGVREAGIVAVLAYAGVPEEQALAFSLLSLACQMLFRGLIGGMLEMGHWQPAPKGGGASGPTGN